MSLKNINTSNVTLKNENYNWAKEVNDYQTAKKNLEWGTNPKQCKVTHKDIKSNEVFFNPVLQKYNNKNIENRVKSVEQRTFPDKIAKFYDKSLRYEQTFNIINLKDKLNVFKDHNDYPKMKERKSNLIDHSKTDFNILSNKKLTEHHFERPDKRPIKPSTSPIIKKEKKQAWSFKDYDIISNQYLENNESKKKVDEIAFKLESANKYWKTHNFDLIAGQYYNKNKEIKYQSEQAEREKSWGKDQVLKLPKKVQDQGLLYNPVNQQVLDSQRLAIYEQKERNKKKKYEKRKDMEDYYFKKAIVEENRKDKMSLNKKNYEEYKEIDNRGYNIINFEKNFNNYKSNSDYKINNNGWNNLKQKSNETSAINRDKIFKHAYDYSDTNINLHNFKKERNCKILLTYN
jgi:hypothetical protein